MLTIAFAVLVGSAMGCAPQEDEVAAQREIAVGAFFATHELFLRWDAATGRPAGIRPTIERYYADPRLTQLVELFEGNVNCPDGECASLVIDYGVESVTYEDPAWTPDGPTVAGELRGWVTYAGPYPLRRSPIGEWFRYRMAEVGGVGWRVVEARQGFLPGFEP